HAVGYDVAGALDEVWEEFEQAIGLALLKCLHLNDSKGARGSRLDRHEWIGEGTIGAEAFRRVMSEPRLAPVIKIVETPKGDDPVRHDRRMLRRLRAYARAGAPAVQTVGSARTPSGRSERARPHRSPRCTWSSSGPPPLSS